MAFHDELLRLAERVGGSREVAEDVLQDVFLSIWRARTRWRVANSLRAYLRRAVQNTALRARTSKTRQGPLGLPLGEDDDTPALTVTDSRPTPEDQAAFDELAAAAEAATRGLSPRARDVFLMRRDEELSNREIAARLGVSVKTVETHMRRALGFMRRRLTRWLDDPRRGPGRR